MHLEKGVQNSPVKYRRNAQMAYFYWLIEQIGTPNTQTWEHALKVLFDIEFYWTVPNDSNRAIDVQGLIEEYERTTHQKSYTDGSASVLEVLIGIALRMDFQLDGIESERDRNVASYFYELLTNLGICEVVEKAKDERQMAVEITAIVNRWLARMYEPSGKGGIFPLDEVHVFCRIAEDMKGEIMPRSDQREAEIWTQMSCYMQEKYLHF